jgi:hypothetical protein
MLSLTVPPSQLTRLIVASHLVAATITHPNPATTPLSITLSLPLQMAIALQMLNPIM